MSVYPLILHNGRFIDQAAAVIPIDTPALLGALGVYETMLVERGRIIALAEHLSRLETSARGAELTLGVDAETLSAWCMQTVAANHPDGLLRVLACDLGQDQADVFMYLMSAATPSPQEYEQGVDVVIYHGERALPLVKSFNTLVPGLARKAAVRAGAHDALLVDNDGNITEGTNCNVFAVIDGTLVIPPVGSILEGTVMDQVIRLASAAGISCQRRPLPLAEVGGWDEAFLTSTRRGVLPIRHVGEHDLGPPGPITRRLGEAYQAWETDCVMVNVMRNA